MLKYRCQFVTGVIILLTLAGCGRNTSEKPDEGSAKPANSEMQNQKPVTLTIALTAIPEETFKEWFDNDYMKKKFPNVTFKYSLVSDLEKMVGAGLPPDIVNVTYPRMFAVLDAGLKYDMTPLIKKQNFNLSQFTDQQLTLAKSYSDKGEYLALPGAPFRYSTFGLAYNKDLFDKFAVAYPKDGMTWDQAIELSKAFNRTDGGIQYHGLVIYQAGLNFPNQIDASLFDQNGKINTTSQKWVDVFNMLKKAVVDQGQWEPAISGGLDLFMKDKSVAMYAGVLHGLLNNADKEEGQLNWDMVSYPSFPGRPNVVPSFGLYTAITSTCKNKDLALQVIDAWTKEDTPKKEFENPLVLKRNINALKNKTMSTYMPVRNSPPHAANLLVGEIGTMISKQTDVNSALRELQEQLQKDYDQVEH